MLSNYDAMRYILIVIGSAEREAIRYNLEAAGGVPCNTKVAIITRQVYSNKAKTIDDYRYRCK